MLTREKLIIRPRMVTWEQCKAEAKLYGGRLLRYQEIISWSQHERIAFDVWVDRKDSEDSAQYFDSTKGDIRMKSPDEQCLCVFFASIKKLNELRASKEQLMSLDGNILWPVLY